MIPVLFVGILIGAILGAAVVAWRADTMCAECYREWAREDNHEPLANYPGDHDSGCPVGSGAGGLGDEQTEQKRKPQLWFGPGGRC